MTTAGPVHDELQGFGLEARQAVVAAQDAARSMRHERVGTEHLLLGLLADPEVGQVLKDAGLSDGAARRKIAEAVPVAEPADPKAPLPRTPRCGRAIGRATRFARDDHADLAGCRHLLLGVLDVEGTAGQVLCAASASTSSTSGHLSARMSRASTRRPSTTSRPSRPQSSLPRPCAAPTAQRR